MNNDVLTWMLQLSREMAETRDINQLLSFAMEKTMDVARAELCYLILLDANGGLEYRARSSLLDENGTAQTGDALSRSIFDQVIHDGEPVVITDALTDPNHAAKSSIIDLRIRSVMCVPLITRGETLGAIYVENRTIPGAFRTEDLEPLIFFANQAAVSIENAQIIANLEDLIAARTAEAEKGWHEAVEANKMRTTLLGQLAHDMRTPATVVSLALGMLRSERIGEINETQQQWLERAAAGMEQMSTLISNVFDLSKVEMNMLTIHRERVDLAAFLQRVHEIALALQWSEDVAFEIDLASPLPEVEVDPVRIQQVLMNLISNALKFTQAGAVVLHAQAVDDHTVEIGVRDTGEGIPEAHLATIFERFSQVDTDERRRTAGAGLGLAICRELVEKHGGRIWVSSTPGQGSDFIFRLPA